MDGYGIITFITVFGEGANIPKHLSNHQPPWPCELKSSNKSFNKNLKEHLPNKKQTSNQPTKQTNKQINKQFKVVLVLHQGEVRTTAYDGMSCYGGYEGYGTGWDPWLGGCDFFKKVASSWLVDVCFLYRAYRLYGFLGTKKGILASPIYG